MYNIHFVDGVLIKLMQKVEDLKMTKREVSIVTRQ